MADLIIQPSPERHTRHDASSAAAQDGGQFGVIILGMHRSGTSCLAGMLQCAGFYAGEVALWSSHNRRGNREDPRINDLNELILRISGGSWRDPPDTVRWTSEAASERNEILRLLADSREPWMFKDPRSLLTLPFWLDAHRAIGRLGIWRNPLSVAQSLATRNGLPIAKGLELWVAYNATLIAEHRRVPFPIVCFDLPQEAFVAAVGRALDVLCRDLVRIGRLRLDRLGEFFDDTLVHQSVEIADPVFAVSGLPGVAASLVERVAGQYRDLCWMSGYDAPMGEEERKGGTTPGAILHGLVDIEKAAAEGDFSMAWRSCERMVESAPQRVDLWLRLVELAKATGDQAQLAVSISRGLSALPADPNLWFEQAKLHWKARTYDEAFHAAERVSVLAPDWIEPQIQLGSWAAARKRWTEVERWLAPLASNGRSNSRSEVLRGVAAIHMGEIERGNRLISTAIGRAPPGARADGLHRWGNALRGEGLRYEARTKLTESFALNPADADVATSLATLQQELGDDESALETVRTALAAGADSAKLRLTSARIRQERGQDPDSDIIAGLKLDPRHHALQRLAGQRAYARSDFSAALEHFLASAPGRNPIGALLGAARCYVRLGDAARATALLDDVLAQAPDHTQARRMREELARPVRD